MGESEYTADVTDDEDAAEDILDEITRIHECIHPPAQPDEPSGEIELYEDLPESETIDHELPRSGEANNSAATGRNEEGHTNGSSGTKKKSRTSLDSVNKSGNKKPREVIATGYSSYDTIFEEVIPQAQKCASYCKKDCFSNCGSVFT